MLPRDVMSINPCFRHQTDLSIGGVEWAPLAQDLADGLATWSISPATRQLTVKLYKIEDPVAGEPHRPQATVTKAAGTFLPTPGPGEIAVCLSFYGGSNAPYNRGRLYIPFAAFSGSAPAGSRPSAANRTKVGDLVPLFAGLGGVNVDWIVWSPTKKAATKVDHWWVDDEWDTQRRRGLKPTTRTAGTTGG